MANPNFAHLPIPSLLAGISLFAEHVNCINNINCVAENVNLAALPLQELEQAKKDVHLEARHRYNKLAIDGKIRRFVPFKAELVD